MSEQYKRAGVNLEAGYEAVEKMKKHITRTLRSGTMGGIGGFGGLFNLGELHYQNPVLVSGTDGVGTKLMIAIEMDRHHTIGIDAVAMCANDVIVQGASPLFFLDYIAIGKNDPSKVENIVSGVAEGCVQAQCALIGGETAEMPDMYQDHHYDIAGFCVGVAEKDELINKDDVRVGDVLVALPSSGCHSNGFSLIRQILIKDNHQNLKVHISELGKSLGEELLTPTKIYVKPILGLLQSSKKKIVHTMAHITGGGFYENLPRMINSDLGVSIDRKSLNPQPIFSILQKMGNLNENEMFNVFNMGVGYVLAVEATEAMNVCSALKQFGENAFIIGEVTKSGMVVIK